MAAGADASAPCLPLDRSVHWEREKIVVGDTPGVDVMSLALFASDDEAHMIVGIRQHAHADPPREPTIEYQVCAWNVEDSRLLWQRMPEAGEILYDLFPIVLSNGARVVAIALGRCSLLMMPLDEKMASWRIDMDVRGVAQMGAFCEGILFWSGRDAAFRCDVDAPDSARKGLFKGHTGDVTSLDATTYKGQVLLATASADHAVRLWDGDSGAPAGANPAILHGEEVRFVAFLPRAEEDEPLRALSMARPLVARVWSVEDRATIFESTERAGFNAIVCRAWVPDGAIVPAVLNFTIDDKLVLWRPDEDGEVIALGGCDYSILSVNSSRIVCSGSLVAWIAREYGRGGHRQYIAIARPAPAARTKAARA